MNDRRVYLPERSSYKDSYSAPEKYSLPKEYTHENRRNRINASHEDFQLCRNRSRSPVATNNNYDEISEGNRVRQGNFPDHSSNAILSFDYGHKPRSYPDLQGESYERTIVNQLFTGDFRQFEDQNRFRSAQDNFSETTLRRSPVNFQPYEDQGGVYPGMLNDKYDPKEILDFENHGQTSMEHAFPLNFPTPPEFNFNSIRNAPTNLQQPLVKTVPFAVNPEGQQPECSGNTNIKMYITDRSMSDGKIKSKKMQRALSKALKDMMLKELLSDDFSVRPKFQSSRMHDDVYMVTAVDKASAEFLMDKVHKMPPPWEGAKLYVDSEIRRQSKIETLVPGERIGWEQLLNQIRHFDSNIRVEKWQRIGIREHTLGHVFTFLIDSESYNLLDTHGGCIPYGGTNIEFRALRSDI